MSNQELETLESPMFREKLREDSPFILRTRSAGEMAGDHPPLEDDDISTTATSLHSSFDAALLGSEEPSSQIFRAPPRVSMAQSWDEGHSVDHHHKGKKHILPPHQTGGADLVPPTTVRKQPRSSSESAVRTPARPLRLPPGSAVKARTPSSSSRRRKAAPLHNRKCKSPFHQRASPSSSSTTPARPPFPVRETGLFSKDTPFHSTPAPYHPSQTKANKVQTCNTVTTANSSALDITIDTEHSHESPVSTPFRFTSFPASLPRVHPAEKQTSSSATRKKACFSQAQLLEGDATTVIKRARPMNVMTEESAHNSSLSSMSEQGIMQHATSFPPHVLEWKSPHGNKTLQSKYSDDSEPEQARQSVIPGGLFLDNNSEQYSYSSDESPIRVSVPRTRLNFNVVMSPGNNEEVLEDSKPASANRASPALRPSSPTPASPAEVQFRVELDAAQCSPILPHKEADFCDASPLERPLSPVEEGPPTTQSAHSKLSLSQESSISSSSSSKQRRLRPMPDMSAFDARASMRSAASSVNDKSDDTPPSPKLTCPPTPVRTPAWAHGDSAGNPFVRANSLILTKVLATCPVNAPTYPSENCAMKDENGAVVGEVEKRRASLSFSTVDEEMEDMSGEKHSSADSSTPPPGAALFSTGVPLQELSMNPNVAVAHRPGKGIAKTPTSSTSHDDGVSFAKNFENLGQLGSGAFADVYKVRSREDCQYYAVKRNRRQFRGKRDRDMAMTEVRTMQKLQSVCTNTNKPSYNQYVLFFYRAWQEEGYFHCQTELCCRDTCRELMDSLRCKWSSAVTMYPSLTNHLDGGRLAQADDGGRLVPDATVWKILHDVAAGLSHIHSHGIAHHDIKPSNIFFVSHVRVGAMCKIGDFGMAGEIGTVEDGQEGDTVYMPPELLSSSAKQPSADIFSLGLTIYELASSIGWEMPVEGPRWHELRDGSHLPELPPTRHADLGKLIQATIRPDPTQRPSADDILSGLPLVKEAGSRCDEFLRDYLRDVEQYDLVQERRRGPAQQTPRTMEQQRELRTPTPGIPLAPFLFTPNLGGSDKAN